MGMHYIEFAWNITVKNPHKVVVIRHGGYIWDTLELRLDGNTIMSRPTESFFFAAIGSNQFSVDDNSLEVRWKWGANGDPQSIVLILGSNKVIGQYGDNSAAGPNVVFEIASSNLIPLIVPSNSNITSVKPPINLPQSTSDLSSVENVSVYFQQDVEVVDAKTEQINVLPNAAVNFKRSRTFERTIDIKWSTVGEIKFELGIQQVISASIRGQIEQARGSSFKESETIEHSVELAGGKKGKKYKLVWKDLWRKGIAEVSYDGQTWVVPFRFCEETKFEILDA